MKNKNNNNLEVALFDIRETKAGSMKYKYYWITNEGNSLVTYSYKPGQKNLKQYATSSTREGKQYLAFSSNDLSCKYVHQAVAEMFVHNPTPELTPIVNHKDGDRLNNHHSNLEWVSYRQNYWHGRGDKNYKNK
jgi:hypothetical protein